MSYAAIGDAALVVCRPGAERGRQLNKEATRFVGQPMNKRSLKNNVQRSSVALDPADWVVLATNGLSEFIAPLRPADVVPRVLDRTRERACAGGRGGARTQRGLRRRAGDNVAVAVLSPA